MSPPRPVLGLSTSVEAALVSLEAVGAHDDVTRLRWCSIRSYAGCMKLCTKCRVRKHESAFYAKRSECKDCANAARRAYNAAHPEHVRRVHRDQKLKRYGMVEADYARLLAEQDGRCAICLVVGVVDPTSQHRLGVDHDHSTGRVRGLLCRPCNRAVGILNDDPELFERAARYLKQPQF